MAWCLWEALCARRAVGEPPCASCWSVRCGFRRLQSELMALMMSGESGLSAFPDGDNIFQWTGTITGGEGTVRRAPSAAHRGTARRKASPDDLRKPPRRAHCRPCCLLGCSYLLPEGVPDPRIVVRRVNDAAAWRGLCAGL